MRYAFVTLFLSVYFFGFSQNDSVLTVGVKSSPPFIIANEAASYTGLSIDLWETVSDRLGLNYRYKEYDLSGLLQALESGEVDVAISPLTVTSERLERFPFSQPYYITNLAIATQSKSGGSFWAFIQNFFSRQFFAAIGLLLLVILIFGVLEWLFERKRNSEEFGGGARGVWEGLWWSAVTMTTVGYGDRSPKTVGGRVVALVWMFTAIIIISGFTASIASALTVQNLGSDISNLSDLKHLSVGTVQGSSSAAFLEQHGIGYQGANTIEEGMTQLQTGALDAFVYDRPILRYIIQRDLLSDELQVLPNQFLTQYYAFAFPRGSKLVNTINPVILDVINDITWNAMMRKYNLLE